MPRTAAWQRYATASATLARRWRGLPAAGQDWLCPQAVSALVLPLAPERQTALRVVLRDGVSARELPRTLAGLPLTPIRAPDLRAEGGPPLMTLARTRQDGTATALVRDRLNPQRCYLLTCGHVVAPDDTSRFDDQVFVALPPGNPAEGRLREWQPAVGPGNGPSTLDAALVELDADSLAALRQRPSDWLPQGLSDDVRSGRPVALQLTSGPLDGVLCDHWSGAVGALGANYPDYFLQDAIGCRFQSSTQGGDSGAAVWTEGDTLLGMHVGSIDAPSSQGATTVMARVRPALDWFCVKPFTRGDPATITPTDWPQIPVADDAAALSPAKSASAAGDAVVLARTLWGEARGEGRDGMVAVAAVVLNRFKARYRGCTTVSRVCLDPYQFSCWNANDPNRRLLARIDQAPDAAYAVAGEVARQALGGQLVDPTRGAKHYVAVDLPLAARPDWLDDKTPCAVIGRHEFYNDIR